MKVVKVHTSQTNSHYIITDFADEIIFTDDLRPFGYVQVGEGRIDVILNDHINDKTFEEFIKEY